MGDEAVSGDLVRDSKFLSYVLRHRPDAIGIALDDAGWVPVDTLLAALAVHGRPLDRTRLDRIVTGLDKKRLELWDGRIRAAQGHSVPVDLQLAPLPPPEVLFHGTVERFLAQILVQGLRPQGRTHVHLSADVATARTVGARRGRPLVLTVAAGRMHAAGQVFVRARNGVWLTEEVPAQYLTRSPE